MRIRAAHGLAVVASAGLYAASLPPLGWWPLGWIALTPLIAALARVSPAGGAVLGAAWGVVATTFVVGWFLPAMLQAFFGLRLLTAWAAQLAIGTVLVAPYTAAFGAWLAWRARRGVSPLAIGAAWALGEWARVVSPIGTPWGLLAYGQTGAIGIAQTADLAGPYATSALAAAVGALGAAIVTPAVRGRSGIWAIAGVGVTLLAAILYGQFRLAPSAAPSAAIRVAALQAASATPSVPLARWTALARQTAVAQSQLVVWPEHAIDGYLQESTPEQAAILALSRELGADLLVGSAAWEAGVAGPSYRNAIYVVRDGMLAGRYDKRRLLPIAEQTAFGTGGARYTPGRLAQPLRTSAGFVGVLLCSEVLYPALTRELASQGATLLVNPSNDAWYPARGAVEHMLAAARFRAIESRRPLIRSSTGGRAAIVDAGGRLTRVGPLGEDAAIAAEVTPNADRTFYTRRGDAWVWLALIVAAGI